MDFLDPQKQYRHTVVLYVGYVLIALAILIGTVLLLDLSNGYSRHNGQIVQNGLVFFSSQPNAASIKLNGVLNKSQTNTRLAIPAGQYSVDLHRSGYRDWRRTITVQGGDVQHFDYPFLFPTNLSSKSIGQYNGLPEVASQSLDHRWLLVQQIKDSSSFDLYDLKDPTKIVTTTVNLPSNIVTSGTTESWQVVQWADDNQHVLLKHTFDSKTEFIVLDRQNPDQSVNLNKLLAANPTSVSLNNNKYDQYYLYTASSEELDTANSKSTAPTLFLKDVLSYKSYGTNTMLYATPDGASAGKVAIDIFDGNKSYKIREAVAGTTYLMDMAGYNGTPYVVIAIGAENSVYVYKDPLGQLGNAAVKLPAPIRKLAITNPTYISFSPTAQFVMAESGSQFGVYDVYLSHAYSYTLTQPLDAPQPNASWMDGNRLTYVSNGKLFVFDYDKANQQTLLAASANYLPFFSSDYHYLYTLNGSPVTNLNQTPLLTKADL